MEYMVSTKLVVWLASMTSRGFVASWRSRCFGARAPEKSSPANKVLYCREAWLDCFATGDFAEATMVRVLYS